MQVEPKCALIKLIRTCSVIPDLRIIFFRKKKKEKEQFGSVINTPDASKNPSLN